MLDVKWILANPEQFDHVMLLRRNSVRAADVQVLHDARLKYENRLQELRTEQNQISQSIGKLKRANAYPEAIEQLLAHAETIKLELNQLALQDSPATALNDLMLGNPNIFEDTVPVGVDETENVLVASHGVTTKQNLQHFELTGLMDFETAGKIHGSRFTILRGELAGLERAIGQFMLDTHVYEHKYTEINVPVLVTSEALYGTGQLPKFKDDLYAVGNKWLIPTSEVPLTNLARETIAPTGEVQRYTALTNCFRSEAGAAGRDVRGMLRQHQFNKVELVSIVEPAAAKAEHLRTLACAEKILSLLDLPYRVVQLCTGDTGFSAKSTYDLEVWLPGQQAYREISSVSWCGDFQARRMNARFRSTNGVEYFHTINGSGLAVGRTLIAVLENFTEDGLLYVPKPLQPYLRNKETISLR